MSIRVKGAWIGERKEGEVDEGRREWALPPPFAVLPITSHSPSPTFKHTHTHTPVPPSTPSHPL